MNSESGGGPAHDTRQAANGGRQQVPGKGYLVAIGGNEDKKSTCEILSRFVSLLPDDPNLVIIPSASVNPLAQIRRYTRVFKRLGVAHIHGLPIKNPQEANDRDNLRRLEQASGVFLTGGDQYRLMRILKGSAFESLLLERYRSGMTLGGTSAGAAVLSHHIIVRGRSGLSPRARMAKFGTGLGLTRDIIIDQHFTQRGRLGRLTLAVAMHPGIIGVGIDEDTAVILDPQDCLNVIGSGSVAIVDGHAAEVVTWGLRENHLIPIQQIKFTFLNSGCTYDLSLNRAYFGDESQSLAWSA